jgi:hypothetical protein
MKPRHRSVQLAYKIQTLQMLAVLGGLLKMKARILKVDSKGF